MRFHIFFLKQYKRIIVTYILFSTVFFFAFALYRLPLEAVLYPALLCALLGLMILGQDAAKGWRRHQTFQQIAKLPAALMDDVFPAAGTQDDKNYQQIIQLLRQEQSRLSDGMDLRYSDMVEYYTVWAHQIKTPIASMRLHLQNEDSALSRKLSTDLFRIEQYAEMVLAFLRLDSASTDYVIKEYNLDSIVRPAVKRFAQDFIGRKLQLVYVPLNATVISDEKWLSFVIEQVLSNAIKYTPAGCVEIRLESPKTLCISDTGIGIAPEDLPRIFEKGYTGYNGREDRRATGIGLYLCKRICRQLGHEISAASVPEHGTQIRIDLSQRKLEAE